MSLPGAVKTVARRSAHPFFLRPFSPAISSHLTSGSNLRNKDRALEEFKDGNVYAHGAHGHEEAHPAGLFTPLYIPRTPLTSLVNSTTLFKRGNKFNFVTRRYSTAPVHHPSDKKRVAVVLSGSGVYDGSEIHEAVSVLVHLSRAGVDVRCFAPDIEQSDVINHVKGTPTVGESRNVLVEAARIARGKIKPLSTLTANTYSAVIFPGGYGAAKNLCTFASQGENHTVQPDVARVINEFHSAKKPIGLLCVSPVIAAKLIPGVSVTLGNEDKDIDKAIEKMGAKPVSLGVLDVNIDNQHNIITSPAYMTNSPIHKVFDGIGKFVDTLLSRAEPAEEEKAH